MENLALVVPSIGCQGCMKKIVRKLETLSSVEIVQTDVPGKSLSVRYQPEQVSTEQIEAAIRDIGHRVASPASM
jgi:copper chaperone CopZ